MPTAAMPNRPNAGRESDGEGGQHHDRVLRVLDLGAIANQVRSAGDAERARQAGADDEHDQRADDGQHDLRFDDRGIAPRRPGAARPKGERGAEQRGDRQAHGGMSESGAEVFEQFLRLRTRCASRRRRRGLRRLCRRLSRRSRLCGKRRDRPEQQRGDRHHSHWRGEARSTRTAHSCPSVEALTLGSQCETFAESWRESS